MTKTELLNELATGFKLSPVVDLSQEIVIPDLKMYKVQIFEEGKSEDNKKDTGYHKEVIFYVYDEGGAGEKAFYSIDEPKNTADTDISGSSLLSISKIYTSGEMSQRVQAACIVAAIDIINEDSGTANHDKRLLWAGKVMGKDNWWEGTNTMLGFIAANATIQSNGGTASDNDIKYVVNSNINNATVILGL